jgi:hypothetical protein
VGGLFEFFGIGGCTRSILASLLHCTSRTMSCHGCFAFPLLALAIIGAVSREIVTSSFRELSLHNFYSQEVAQVLLWPVASFPVVDDGVLLRLSKQLLEPKDQNQRFASLM